MKVIIFGATGMVGQGVLRECLLDDEISSLLIVGRTTTGIASPKLHEIQQADLLDYGPIESRLAGFDACFFCLGISSAAMKEADYERLTYGVTLAAAQTLSRLNPDMVFTYVSGEGTDSSEHGRVMWARVKGAHGKCTPEAALQGCVHVSAGRYPAHARGCFENEVLPVALRGHGAGPTSAPMGVSEVHFNDRDHRPRHDKRRATRLSQSHP